MCTHTYHRFVFEVPPCQVHGHPLLSLVYCARLSRLLRPAAPDSMTYFTLLARFLRTVYPYAPTCLPTLHLHIEVSTIQTHVRTYVHTYVLAHVNNCLRTLALMTPAREHDLKHTQTHPPLHDTCMLRYTCFRACICPYLRKRMFTTTTPSNYAHILVHMRTYVRLERTLT